VANALVALVLALTASSALASTAPVGQNGAEMQVRVRVRNGDTGQWLMGAKVKAGEDAAFTDTNGECFVTAIAGQRLILTTSIRGAFTAIDTFVPGGPDAQLVVKLYGTQPRTAIGFVRNGSSGKPLARALVKVIGDTARTRTDSTGMFAIPFPPGDRELIAALPGFRGFARRLTVRAGDTLACDLPLYEESLAVGEIAGHVDVQGLTAAIGASVTVEGTQLGTASNRTGDYIITGVPAGEHRLIITYAGCKKAMRVVTVQPWETLEVDVELVPSVSPVRP